MGVVRSNPSLPVSETDISLPAAVIIPIVLDGNTCSSVVGSATRGYETGKVLLFLLLNKSTSVAEEMLNNF